MTDPMPRARKLEIKQARRIRRAKRELTTTRCPECGRTRSNATIAEHRRDAHGVRP